MNAPDRACPDYPNDCMHPWAHARTYAEVQATQQTTPELTPADVARYHRTHGGHASLLLGAHGVDAPVPGADSPIPVEPARVLAALAELGWPDDRAGSAHVEPGGYEVTGAGHYWDIACAVIRAADAAA